MSAPEPASAIALARRVGALALAILVCAAAFVWLPDKPGWPLLSEFPIVAPVVAVFVLLTLLERVFNRLWP